MNAEVTVYLYVIFHTWRLNLFLLTEINHVLWAAKKLGKGLRHKLPLFLSCSFLQISSISQAIEYFSSSFYWGFQTPTQAKPRTKSTTLYQSMFTYKCTINITKVIKFLRASRRKTFCSKPKPFIFFEPFRKFPVLWAYGLNEGRTLTLLVVSFKKVRRVTTQLTRSCGKRIKWCLGIIARFCYSFWPSLSPNDTMAHR